jgi:double-stranded uracil-DNA glycosylase
MVLPDLLNPGLDVVFCGTAVGDQSAQRQAYYAGPGNRFWDVLAETCMTPHRLTPDQYPLLLKFRVGLTDLVKRKSGQDVRLSTEDFDVAGFHAKIEKFAPKAVGFNGKKSAQVYFGRSTVEYGVQIAKIEGTALFVLPSTSGAARGFWDSKYWFQLAKFVSR